MKKVSKSKTKALKKAKVHSSKGIGAIKKFFEEEAKEKK